MEAGFNATKGFTLIEVMFSLIIFMIALMGLVSLQRVSIEGAARGRQHTAAANVASFFFTQLKNEISCWGPNITRPFPGDRFPMLTNAIGANATLNDIWYELNPGDSVRVDDLLGHSKLADGDTSSRFCVNYRISCLETPRDATSNSIPCAQNMDRVTVWKVRVRVSWAQQGQFGNKDGDDNNIPWTSCDPNDVNYRVDQSRTDNAVELVGVATRELAI
jgi:Tfp pilus assembly protein PilV